MMVTPRRCQNASKKSGRVLSRERSAWPRALRSGGIESIRNASAPQAFGSG